MGSSSPEEKTEENTKLDCEKLRKKPDNTNSKRETKPGSQKAKIHRPNANFRMEALDRPKIARESTTMLAALKKAPSSTSMASLKAYIDPSLKDLYPHDCVYKMAVLAKECVDEDPILRPDMKQVVISLSHILLSSVEWEATLAGNSQVFSGLVQGR
ncbi:LysM domain receptor-like kinase 3 [Dendrobium catenatum]|uniref:LysM domain receptor-like kinase 3 n=1 Tax=Dendrobium catenatum TaxID=906689 RepID=A0A2I0WEN3_9ASPA|nr:LysM domain receptor-like kinase 3 [Dendrobium catenatum]